MKPKTVYVSYDGILEPLGYSQIVCYLKKLSENYEITLLSYEKKKYINNENISSLKNELNNFNIKWHFLHYHHFPRILSTVFDIFNGLRLLFFLIYKKRILLIHSRSYIASFMVMIISLFFQFKLIFDMRGFWIDEKSDRNGLSRQSLTYKFFKKVEKFLILRSDVIITLTYQSKKIITDNFSNHINKKIYVIPTCADEQFFKPPNYKRKNNKDIIFGYIGSIDTAYNIEKIIASFSMIILQFSNAKLKILTNNLIFNLDILMKKYQIPNDKYLVKYVNRDKIIHEIHTFDFGIFYINKNYSSLASFPTKISEYLLCGKPVICNNFNEDITNIISENNIGIINEFDKNDHKMLINFINNNYYNEKISKNCREFAINRLSLLYGSSEYNKIYNKLSNC